MKPYHKLLLGLVLGALFGTALHSQIDVPWLASLNKNVFEIVGQIFLRLIFMIVVPLVFSGLVLGVYQLSQHHGLKRVVTKTLIYTLLTSTASVFIGILLVNLLKPGAGLNIPTEIVASQTSSVEKLTSQAQATKPLTQILVDLIPKNPIDSAARALDGEMISLMVFALIFGLALSRTLKKSDSVILSTLEQIYDASMNIVAMVMKIAPLAVFCLVFSTSFKFGFDLLKSLAFYVIVVVLGLLIQNFGVYSVLLKTIAKRRPRDFFHHTKEVLLYAFATASSNATLPRTLECATEKLKLAPDTSRFVLTVGSTANQNGTALFEGVTVLFLAQVYGIHLDLAQQIQVVVMSVLAGIGTAGVPGGSLPLIMIVLQQVGIPAEGMGIILGVDRFLDMCRTAVNVSGNLVIATLVEDKK